MTKQSPKSMAQLKEILPHLGPKDLVVDVREPSEFSEGHISGAKNYPLGNVAAFAKELGQYDNIYIHCRAGRRAQTAFEALKQAGLSNMHCISEDGMAAWEQAGFPTLKGSR